MSMFNGDGDPTHADHGDTATTVNDSTDNRNASTPEAPVTTDDSAFDFPPAFDDDDDLPAPLAAKLAPPPSAAGPGPSTQPAPAVPLQDSDSEPDPRASAAPAPTASDSAEVSSSEAFDDDDDDFFHGALAPPAVERSVASIPAPSGAPPVGGYDTSRVPPLDDWDSDDDPDVSPPAMQLWTSDDIVPDVPTVVSDTVGNFSEPEPADDHSFSDEFSDDPETEFSTVDAGPIEESFASDDLEREPDAAAEPFAGDEEASLWDQAPADTDAAEYFGADEGTEYIDDDYFADSAPVPPAPLDPETLWLPDSASAQAAPSLRERSKDRESRRDSRRTKKIDDEVEKKRGAAATSDNGGNRRYYIAAGVLTVCAVAGVYMANRDTGGNSDPTADSPDTSVQGAPGPAPATPVNMADINCGNPNEEVGKAIACAAVGNQDTGTNAILAYDHAFYSKRDGAKAYSLTNQPQNDPQKSAAGAKTIQQQINMTACGSKYALTITPKEIGRIYDVTVMVTAPKNGPQPSADGQCADVPETPEIKTTTLVQTVTVSGDAGSYAVRKIDTHQVK